VIAYRIDRSLIASIDRLSHRSIAYRNRPIRSTDPISRFDQPIRSADHRSPDTISRSPDAISDER